MEIKNALESTEYENRLILSEEGGKMQNPLLFSSEIQFISQKAKSEAPFSIS